MMESDSIVVKLLLLAENFSQIYLFKLNKKKPFIPKGESVEFNLGRKSLISSYPYSKVILKQSMIKEPKYRAAITPLDNDTFFVVVPTDYEDKNGELIIKNSIFAKWMGLSKSGMMNAIGDLTNEIDKTTMKLIEEKKSSIETMKKYQEAIIDLEARYSGAFVESLDDLAGRISEKEDEIAKETQSTIVKKRREDTEPPKKEKDDTKESEETDE